MASESMNMSKEPTFTRDDAAAHLNTFRIFDLPQELRDMIYEYALDARITFRHSCLDYIGPAYSLPRLEYHEDEMNWNGDAEEFEKDENATSDTNEPEASLYSKRELLEKDEFVRDANSPDDFHVLLRFKIQVATTLHLVSKDMSAEVAKILPPAKAVREMIYLHRIVLPTSAFVNMWSHSQLILEVNAGSSTFFLKNLPDVIKSKIRRLVLGRENMAIDDDRAQKAWERDVDDRVPFFIRFIRQDLPNLDTLAIQVPHNLDFMQWYCHRATGYACDLLRDGHINTLFFYYISLGRPVETNQYYLKHISLNRASKEEFLMESADKGQSPLDGHGEDVSDSPKDELWRDLEASYVVRITRPQADS